MVLIALSAIVAALGFVALGDGPVLAAPLAGSAGGLLAAAWIGVSVRLSRHEDAPEAAIRQRIGAELKEAYAPILTERLPERFAILISQLPPGTAPARGC